MSASSAAPTAANLLRFRLADRPGLYSRPAARRIAGPRLRCLCLAPSRQPVEPLTRVGPGPIGSSDAPRRSRALPAGAGCSARATSSGARESSLSHLPTSGLLDLPLNLALVNAIEERAGLILSALGHVLHHPSGSLNGRFADNLDTEVFHRATTGIPSACTVSAVTVERSRSPPRM